MLPRVKMILEVAIDIYVLRLNFYRLNFGSFKMFPPTIFGIGAGRLLAVGI